MEYEVFEKEGKEEYAKVLDLWLSVFNSPKYFKEKCSWYYEPEKNKSKIFLLQGKGEEKILGAIGSVSREFEGKYGATSIGFCSDFAIEEKHRVLRPAILLLKKLIADQGKSTDILFGFPNNRAVGAMCRAGFTVLNDVSRYALVLNIKHYLNKSRLSPLLMPLSPVLNFVIKSYIKTIKAIQCSGYDLVELTEADDSFDKLWHGWIEQCDLFAGKRDKEYVTWRFLENPANNFRLFALRKKSDRQLVGYAVIRPSEEGHWIIFDFFALPTEKALEGLLLGIASKACDEGAHSLSVEFLGNRKIQERILRLRFVERPSERRVVIRPRINEGDQASYYFNADNWYVTSADELG